MDGKGPPPNDVILFRLKVAKLAKVTVALPLFSLVFCFCTAMIFQYKEVTQTFCEVFNVIPSISAVTGVSPQCYFWRIGIALHCTPRFLIATVYYSNYRARRSNIPAADQQRYLWWTTTNYWLNIIENCALIGVTYISNREDYPLHEKLFIVFMTTSIAYMMLNNNIYCWSRPKFTQQERRSHQWKTSLMLGTMASTVGLLYFFYKHRRFCEELAFSYFSFFEYCIAVCNMAYHMTLVWDFPEDEITILSTDATIPSLTSKKIS